MNQISIRQQVFQHYDDAVDEAMRVTMKITEGGDDAALPQVMSKLVKLRILVRKIEQDNLSDAEILLEKLSM